MLLQLIKISYLN